MQYFTVYSVYWQYHFEIWAACLDTRRFSWQKVAFSQHATISWVKSARKLNALVRISRYLNISSRSLLYNSFVRSKFNDCTMVLHFWGTTSGNKIEATEAPTMLTWPWRLRVIPLEVLKSIHILNSDCLNDMFKIKDGNHLFLNTRNLSLTTKKKATTVGLRSVMYLDAKLWNDNVCNFSDVRETVFASIKSCIDDPSVLQVDDSDFPYLWWFQHDMLANYVLSKHVFMIPFFEYYYLSFSIFARIVQVLLMLLCFPVFMSILHCTYYTAVVY